VVQTREIRHKGLEQIGNRIGASAMNNKLKTYYAIDLDKKKLEIRTFSGKALAYDLQYYNLKDPLKLSNYDRKVFATAAEAEKYLKKYSKTLNNLDNGKICKKMGIPLLRYKRRYLVQTIMGEKNYTSRNSPRVTKLMSKLKVGDMFNLNDQTFTLTVILTKVITTDNETFKYEFKLP
jgi:hypothetical protein